MYRPTINNLYKHQDGGFYVVQSIALSADDKSEWVVYAHVFPFEQRTWIRRLEEWTYERFQPVTNREMADVMIGTTPEQYQATVAANKAARRAAVTESSL